MRLQAYPPYRHDRFRRVDKRSASTVNRPRAIEFPPWPKPDDKPRFHESLPSASEQINATCGVLFLRPHRAQCLNEVHQLDPIRKITRADPNDIHHVSAPERVGKPLSLLRR